MRLEMKMESEPQKIYNFFVESLQNEINAIYESETQLIVGHTYHKSLKSKMRKSVEAKFKVVELTNSQVYHLEFYNGEVTNHLKISFIDTLDCNSKILYEEFIETSNSRIDKNYKIIGFLIVILNKRKIKKRFRNIDMKLIEG